MKPIITWSFKPWLAGRGSAWRSTSYFLACAQLAVQQIAKFYGTPTMYTGELGKEIFSRLGFQCEYQPIAENDRIPPELWMYEKLVTYSRQSEPYIHFDLDFVVHQRFNEDFLKAGVGFQNLETNMLERPYYLSKVDDRLWLPEVFHKYDISRGHAFNVGVLLFNDLSFNEEYANAAIQACERNAEVARTYDAETGKMITCIIEQQFLGLLAMDRRVQSAAVLNEPPNLCNSYFDHYIGSMKTMWRTEKLIQQFVTPEIIAAAEHLNELRTSAAS
jgi:hypothetical protein